MINIKYIIKFIFSVALVFSQDAFSQIEFEKNPFEKEKAFEYIPQNKSFWEEYLKLKADKKFDDINALINKQNIKTSKTNEKAEIYLAFADAAFEQNHPYVSLSAVFEINKLFPLSNQSIMSFFIIEKIFKNYNIHDRVLISESFLDQDIDVSSAKIPTEIKSFLGYLFSDISYQKRYRNKFKKYENYIIPNSEWALRKEYERGLYELFNNRIDEAIKIFDSLRQNELASGFLKGKAQRQLARLLFEKGEFEKSFDYLKSLQTTQDDTGAVLLERAWNKYYLKHYSKSLGLLKAVSDPIFVKTQTPESDVLQMLIYKELCHYDSVFEVKNEFQKKYSKSIDRIKKRLDLSKDPLLKRWALQNFKLKTEASYITGLRSDKKWIKKYFSDSEISKALVDKILLKEKQIDDEISIINRNELRKVAEKLLDFNEQVNFLDYQTKVDSLRLKKNKHDENYRPESISLVTFDRLYWKYEGELWIDEIENLRVLINSRCEE